MSREVGGLTDAARDGTLTLAGDRPRDNLVAHGDGRSGNGGPAGPRGTPWGVLVRSTNVGDPKINEGKCPPLGGPEVTGTSGSLPFGGWPTVGAGERAPLGEVTSWRSQGRNSYNGRCICLPQGGRTTPRWWGRPELKADSGRPLSKG